MLEENPNHPFGSSPLTPHWLRQAHMLSRSRGIQAVERPLTKSVRSRKLRDRVCPVAAAFVMIQHAPGRDAGSPSRELRDGLRPPRNVKEASSTLRDIGQGDWRPS